MSTAVQIGLLCSAVLTFLVRLVIALCQADSDNQTIRQRAQSQP